jgi:hypothetical protein
MQITKKLKLALFLSAFLVIASVVLPVKGAGGSVTGTAWSPNIGCIFMNCASQPSAGGGGNVCGTNNYGVTASDGGALSGYGWSPNVGWINFSGVSILPGMAPGTSVVTGFASFLGGGAFDGATEDGWDGLLSMTGATYGVTVSPTGDASGYGWGDDVVGWVDFSGVTFPPSEATGLTLYATPASVAYTGSPVTVSLNWVAPVGSGYVQCKPNTGSNTTTGEISSWMGLPMLMPPNGAQSGVTVPGPAFSAVSYSIACIKTGETWDMADIASTSVPITGATEGDAFVNLSDICIAPGDTGTLSWDSGDTVSCTGSGLGFSTGGSTEGADDVNPGDTSTYSISCSVSAGAGGGTVEDEATVTVSNDCGDLGGPFVNLIGVCIETGEGPESISWTSSYTTYCAAEYQDDFDTGGDTSGNDDVNPASTASYKISCDVADAEGGGTISDTATVLVQDSCANVRCTDLEDCPGGVPKFEYREN